MTFLRSNFFIIGITHGPRDTLWYFHRKIGFIIMPCELCVIFISQPCCQMVFVFLYGRLVACLAMHLQRLRPRVLCIAVPNPRVSYPRDSACFPIRAVIVLLQRRKQRACVWYWRLARPGTSVRDRCIAFCSDSLLRDFWNPEMNCVYDDIYSCHDIQLLTFLVSCYWIQKRLLCPCFKFREI